MIDLISISNKAFKTGHSIALLPSPGIFSSRGCLLQEDIVFLDARSVIGLNDILARIDFNSINSINNCLDIENIIYIQ